MFLFWILSVLLVISSLGVIIFKNPIHSALCLITNMIGIAILFAMLDAHFLATVQIIVYAGAIMVLVVFVIMLLNLKVEEPKRNNKFFITSAILAVALFVTFALPIIFNSFQGFKESHSEFNGSMQTLGKVLFTEYIFPFEAASILIMAAVAGAVMLAKRIGKIQDSV